MAGSEDMTGDEALLFLPDLVKVAIAVARCWPNEDGTCRFCASVASHGHRAPCAWLDAVDILARIGGRP